ncbi:hypothetical protein ACFPOI_59045 [Nonomuraea angiospora]|uniref:Tyr recombinase domain-containing protein n=1 Tax=Nonomuraea angiospora TaxID=46172 RepID=A0ABR9LQM4_9ACTN|nr:hypothetical protein [Nonomuraea angiospora]MBE1582950.1 hypothetical protein [Nonomuraea angiospora]
MSGRPTGVSRTGILVVQIAARVGIDIHRLRHAHASTETTQLYALLDDKVADAEIRAARRPPGRTIHHAQGVSCSVLVFR